jgi:serine/threonine protein kinase
MLYHITDNAGSPPLPAATNTGGSYPAILTEFGLSFKTDGYYLLVGQMPQMTEWVLHVSVIAASLEELLKTILPLLAKENVCFRLAANKGMAQLILNGGLGPTALGKVIKLYPVNNRQAASLAGQLIAATLPFKGPRIPTDRHLGGLLYVRHQPSPNKLPFHLPADIHWPFDRFAPRATSAQETALPGKYKTFSVLKEDPRGDVKKALWLEKWYKIKWCVIKQGRQSMAADDDGRDTSDRLRWQFRLHRDLQGSLPLPRAYDLFEAGGDTFLVLEYIKGACLEDVILETYRSMPWWRLSQPHRLRLLEYALRLLDIIQRMHDKGYAHRDITPLNFLVARHGLVMIDLELAWSTSLHQPSPPFRYGTPGYMSPEQHNVQPPTSGEDIYAIGATLVALLTGLIPNKFSTPYQHILQMQLRFFIPDPMLVSIISSCFLDSPARRPGLHLLKKNIREFRDKQLPQCSVPLSATGKPDSVKIERAISSALQALTMPPLTSPAKCWPAGVLYLLAQAQKAGFDIHSCMTEYANSLAYMHLQCEKPARLPAGWFEGAAGMALAMTEGLKNNVIVTRLQSVGDIQSCLLNGTTEDWDLANGMTGRGMVSLNAADLLGGDWVWLLLHSNVEQLISAQQRDGSWISGSHGKGHMKLPGFAHGTAGIICFLLAWSGRFQDCAAQKAAARALYWLGRRNYPSDPGLSEGLAGIILAFLKGYEKLGDPIYRLLAESALKALPDFYVDRDLTLSSGLAGIGETWLEAARVLRSQEYREKAGWLVRQLQHQYRQQGDGSRYWVQDHTPYPTPDLLTGNCGIIHFLLRYHRPDQLNHPLLPV